MKMNGGMDADVARRYLTCLGVGVEVDDGTSLKEHVRGRPVHISSLVIHVEVENAALRKQQPVSPTTQHDEACL